MFSHHAGPRVDEPAWPPIARVIALGLFGLSLVLLFVGDFIQLDDTSGFGSNEWLMPFALLALLAAGGSLVVALSDVSARRLLGAALLLLDVFLAWQVITNDGFRFIWSQNEGELFQLQVGLALAGFALITKSVHRTTAPAGQAPSGLDLTGWARFVGYLTATVTLVFVAFFMGVAHFEYTECSGPDFGGECDVSVLGGLAWSAGAILLAVITIPIIEVLLRSRRRRRSRTG